MEIMEERMKYNYIYFNIEDRNTRKRNPGGYNTICVKDLESLDYVHIVSYPLDYASQFLRNLFYLHHYPKINRIVSLPFKSVWYPYYFKNPFADNKPLCFVISGTYLPVSYLRYLKKTYPDCKLVRIHRDLISLWKVQTPQYTPEVYEELFDLRMSFDEDEAKQYGFPYFVEIESKIDVPLSENYPISDIFFAGRAKDRLPKLMNIYHKLSEKGLHVSYYLTGVPNDKKVNLPGIEYGDRNMQYSEMLRRSVNSRCILEINQEGAVGYTSRFLEAVIYNKRLVTDNVSIRNTKFYNPDYIQCLENVEDIDPMFVLQDTPIDYEYNNEFSPINLIHQIDEILSGRN